MHKNLLVVKETFSHPFPHHTPSWKFWSNNRLWDKCIANAVKWHTLSSLTECRHCVCVNKREILSIQLTFKWWGVCFFFFCLFFVHVWVWESEWDGVSFQFFGPVSDAWGCEMCDQLAIPGLDWAKLAHRGEIATLFFSDIPLERKSTNSPVIKRKWMSWRVKTTVFVPKHHSQRKCWVCV